MLTKNDVVDQLAALMAGAMAEKLIFGNTSNGLSDDLSKATQLAKDAIAKWGMGRYMISEKCEDREEMATFIEIATDKAFFILADNQDFLLKEAGNLLEKEIIQGSEFISRFRERFSGCNLTDNV